MLHKSLQFYEKYLTLCFWASPDAERSNMVSMVFVVPPVSNRAEGNPTYRLALFRATTVAASSDV